MRPDEPVAVPHRIVQPVELPAGWAMPVAAMPAPAGAGPVLRRAMTSAPAPAPSPGDWRSVWTRVEELLGRIEHSRQVDATEVDEVLEALRLGGAPAQLLEAVAALAGAVRDQAGEAELGRRAAAVRKLRPGRRRRFWAS